MYAKRIVRNVYDTAIRTKHAHVNFGGVASAANWYGGGHV